MERFNCEIIELDAAVAAEVRRILLAEPALVLRQSSGSAAGAELTLVCAGRAPAATLLALVARLRARDECNAIVVAGVQCKADELDALLQVGASDFIGPHAGADELLSRVRRCLGLHTAASSGHTDWLEDLGVLRGTRNARLRALLGRLPKLAGSGCHVVVAGERGVGKRALVHALLRQGKRPADIVLDAGQCGAENLSAMMDAVAALAARPEGAVAVILDVHRLAPQVASRLAPLTTAHQGLRLIATALNAHADLDQRIRDRAISVVLPPLRERREDLLWLSKSRLAAAPSHGPKLALSPAAARRLCLHDWPGNLPELDAVMQRAARLCRGSFVGADDIVFDSGLAHAWSECSMQSAKDAIVENFERDYLDQLLGACKGNIALAARVASKNRRALFELIRKHKVDVARYRSDGAPPVGDAPAPVVRERALDYLAERTALAP